MPEPNPQRRACSVRLGAGRQPTESTLDVEALRHGWQTARDHGRVNEAGIHQGRDEVLVLLAEGAKLRDAEVFLVEAPAGELRLASWRRGVRVLDLDQAIPPSLRKRRCLHINAVDAEAMK